MEIKLRVALPDDSIRILKFLRDSYYLEEPLTIGSEPKQQTHEDEEFSLSNIQHGTCIVAVAQITSSSSSSLNPNVSNDTNGCDIRDCDKNNEINCHNEKIIGVAIAGPKYSNEFDHIMEMVEQSETLKWIKLLKLFAFLEQRANVFNRYNVSNAVHLHILGVDKNSRGKSIGLKLTRKCMEISKELGFELFTADCTSIYSIRIAEQLNMDCVSTLKYKEYKDENNEQIFKPPEPHECIKTFAKRL